MSEWQPIETAPKTCDVFLWNGVKVFPGWYCEDEGWHDSRNQDHNDYPEVPQPTHWMPLPTPPVDKNSEA